MDTGSRKIREDHFNKIFWYIVGLTAFGACLSVYVITIDRSHIAMVLTFWLSTGVSGCIGYMIGKSSPDKKSSAPENKQE